MPGSSPTASNTPARHHFLLAAAFSALLLSALAIFWPATSGPFVFDDFPNLGNLAQLNGNVDRAHLGRYLATFTGSPGRPLAALSFLIEDYAWPSEPFAFKRDNLLFHLLAGVLVFVLARRLTRFASTLPESNDWMALGVTAMWLIHPMQLSSTMLVVQRMNILASIFVLAGLAAYIDILGRARWSEATRVIAAGFVLGLTGCLAFLCKENGVLVFAYASALNFTLLRELISGYSSRARTILLLGVGAPIIAIGVTVATTFKSIVGSYGTRDFTMSERLLSESRILIDYVREIFLPRIGAQGIFHDDFAISHGVFDPPATAISLALLALITAAAWRARKKYPWFAFSVSWFIAGHLIESTVWPLELYFEHRNYLPMIGPMLGAIVGISRLRPRLIRIGVVALAGWLLFAASLTNINARVWGDRGLLSAVWLQESPGSTRAVQMRASYLADIQDIAGARRVLSEGLARNPQARELALQIALLDCTTNGLTASEWENAVHTAHTAPQSRIVPVLVAAFGREARGERCLGTMPPGGFVQLGLAAATNPTVQKRPQSVSYIYVELSRQAFHERNLDQTMAFLDEAYDAKSDPLIARTQAIYLISAGLPDPAIEYLRKSEASTWPWFKRLYLDIPKMNAPLWKTANAMQASRANSS